MNGQAISIPHQESSENPWFFVENCLHNPIDFVAYPGFPGWIYGFCGNHYLLLHVGDFLEGSMFAWPIGYGMWIYCDVLPPLWTITKKLQWIDDVVELIDREDYYTYVAGQEVKNQRSVEN